MELLNKKVMSIASPMIFKIITLARISYKLEKVKF